MIVKCCCNASLTLFTGLSLLEMQMNISIFIQILRLCRDAIFRAEYLLWRNFSTRDMAIRHRMCRLQSNQGHIVQRDRSILCHVWGVGFHTCWWWWKPSMNHKFLGFLPSTPCARHCSSITQVKLLNGSCLVLANCHKVTTMMLGHSLAVLNVNTFTLFLLRGHICEIVHFGFEVRVWILLEHKLSIVLFKSFPMSFPLFSCVCAIELNLKLLKGIGSSYRD